jgi:hypothetical protein
MMIELAYWITIAIIVIHTCLLAHLYGERDAQNGKRSRWYFWVLFGIVPSWVYDNSYQETKRKLVNKEPQPNLDVIK